MSAEEALASFESSTWAGGSDEAVPTLGAVVAVAAQFPAGALAARAAVPRTTVRAADAASVSRLDNEGNLPCKSAMVPAASAATAAAAAAAASLAR